MSYTNTFAKSLAIRQRQEKEKQKQANNASTDNGGSAGVGGGSSRVTLRAATTTNNTSTSANGMIMNTNTTVAGGKARTSKAPAASPSPKPQSKPPLSSAPSLLPSARRRLSSSANPLKTSVSIAQSPSDDYTGMLVLKKKPPSKSLPQQQQQALNKYPSFNARRSTKKEPIGFSIKAKDNGKSTCAAEGAHKQEQQDAQQPKNVDVVHEGPMKIPSDRSDLCKIISQSAAWKSEDDESCMYINIDEDNESLKDYDGDVEVDILSDSDVGTKNTMASSVSSSYTVIKEGRQGRSNYNRHHDSHGSSDVPSLTSPPSANNNSGKKKDRMKEIKVDGNNNIIESIKRTIFRSLGFYNVSGTHISSDGRVVDIARSSAILTSAITANAATSSTGVDDGADFAILNEFNESEILSSGESCNVDNNSIQSEDNSAYGVYVRGSDSVLIPLEIEEQLQRAFQFRNTNQEEQLHRRENCSFHHSSPSLRSPNTVCSCLSAKGVGRRKRIDFKDVDSPRAVAFKSSAPDKLSCDTWSQVNKDADKSVVSHTCSIGVSANSSVSRVSTASGLDETDLEDQTCNETQTSSVDVKDAEITASASDSREKLAETVTKKKLLNLVMAVNTGIHIDSTPSPAQSVSTTSTTEQKKKSVRLKGIMKEARPATANPTTSSRSRTPMKTRTRRTNSETQLSDARKRRKEKSRERKALAQSPNPTYAHLDADCGFPTGISISSLIDGIVGLTWASENNKGGRKGSKPKNSLKNCESTDAVITIHDNERKEGAFGEEASLISTAYDMLSAGLKFASGLIGNEEDLEPREDVLRYNGYTIRVCGRKLLLEAVHVNCDFDFFTAGIYSQSTRHSMEALGPHTSSRERLEEDCDGKRIRIVVRLNGPWSVSSSSNSNMQLEETNPMMDLEKHTVSMGEGKWTLIYGDNEELKEKVQNFVEITCPIGVHPVSVGYGLMKGLLLIDAP